MPGHKKARAAQQPAHLMQMPMMQTMLPWGAMNPMQGMNPMMAPMGMQGMMMNPANDGSCAAAASGFRVRGQ